MHLPFFDDSGTICLWDVPCGPIFVTTLCVLLRWCLKEPSDVAPFSKATELPDLPLDAFKLCAFNRWRPGEIINTTFSLVYGVFCSSSFCIPIAATKCLFVKDAVAFSIIVYSMKWRGLTRAQGVPSLLDKIVRDATMYFVVIFTSHLLLVFFEFFAPVSDFLTCLFFSTSDEPHKGTDSAPSCEVGHSPKHCDKDGFDEVLFHPQWERSVSFLFTASSFLFLTISNLK